MSKPRFTPAYPAELRERGVRLFRENRGDYASDTAAYRAIAPKLGCSPDSLRVWCQQAERDAGQRGGLTSAEKDRIKELEREVRELRQANEILKKASAYFGSGGARPPLPQMIAFIDDHRCVHGVGPICRVLGIAPSTYHAFKAVERNPDLASDRARQDRLDMAAIKEVFDGSRGRYGARKVWHQLRREGHDIARCTVERLMKAMGLQGVVRGKKVITTHPDAAQPCPDDKVNRAFVADMPNQLWVSDFTYVSSWQGMVYVAFVIDVFARKIVGWRVSSSMTTGFVLDALNQAICQRTPSETDKLIHHSDRGSQYLSIRYTERLAEAGIDTSVGSVGDSYDNALAESIIGLFKTEVIKFLGPWKSVGQVEWETLKWVDWYNKTRLHSAIGYVTPNEAEEAFYASLNAAEKAA
ncbi:IS3 family transposase (plasmid) [Paracoccus sp. AK26]|nr:IS3 family transposase [Paracoccus sp. AK26]QIR84066.1 IS3 family transposase [Paracoccus sp. AK26]QIR85110.1 IS3 family transposase [Paracoccus sp. AK26]QIR86625.1 IS3 family transposase [Paracoccus sp. AK26]